MDYLDHVERMLQRFKDAHPVWCALLVRLAVVTCYVGAAVSGVYALVVAIAPLAGYSAWLWALVPVLVTVCWACASARSVLYVAYKESW